MIQFSDRALLKILDGATPLEPMSARPNSMFIKRDDTLIQGIGGNKARKLEWVLGEFKQKAISNIVTFGAWGSNHVLTTALCAARFGFTMTAHLSPQPITEEVRKKLLTLNALGVNLISHSNPLSLGAQILFKKNGRGFIHPGASSPLGALGYVKAAIELADQLKSTNLDPRKIQVFVPVGSSGTAAGLLAGFALAGLSKKIELVGVQTVPIHWNLGTYGILRLTNQVIELCEADEKKKRKLRAQVREMWHWSPWDYQPGYGKADLAVHQTIEEFLKTDGIQLDATYSGKAMLRLQKMVATQPEDSSVIQIFWNTYPKYPLEKLNQGQDWRTLPPEFHFIFK